MTRRKKPPAPPAEPQVEEIDPRTDIDARDVLVTDEPPPKRGRGKKKAEATVEEPAPPPPVEETPPPEEPALVEELMQAAATVVKRRRGRKAAETEEERNAAALQRARAAIIGNTPAEAPPAEEAAPEEPSEEPPPSEPAAVDPLGDIETTVNLVGDELTLPGRDDLDPPTLTVKAEALDELDEVVDQRKHLRGLLEALVFASDVPVKTTDLVNVANVAYRQVKDALDELVVDYSERGIHLEEVNGGWVFRTSSKFAPYVRDLTKQRPVRLSRAQVEALAIIAYRQPITRPEIDDVRGVDSGPVLKVLLERDLVRILGKRDEVGRPIIYGTTTGFLEFFGLKSLKDLPTLHEFTELTEESRGDYEAEMGEPPTDLATATAIPDDEDLAEATASDDDDDDEDDDDDDDDDDDESDDDDDDDEDDEDDDDDDDDDEDE